MIEGGTGQNTEWLAAVYLNTGCNQGHKTRASTAMTQSMVPAYIELMIGVPSSGAKLSLLWQFYGNACTCMMVVRDRAVRSGNIHASTCTVTHLKSTPPSSATAVGDRTKDAATARCPACCSRVVHVVCCCSPTPAGQGPQVKHAANVVKGCTNPLTKSVRHLLRHLLRHECCVGLGSRP